LPKASLTQIHDPWMGIRHVVLSPVGGIWDWWELLRLGELAGLAGAKAYPAAMASKGRHQ
jgi:hypothetical protein